MERGLRWNAWNDEMRCIKTIKWECIGRGLTKRMRDTDCGEQISSKVPPAIQGHMQFELNVNQHRKGSMVVNAKKPCTGLINHWIEKLQRTYDVLKLEYARDKNWSLVFLNPERYDQVKSDFMTKICQNVMKIKKSWFVIIFLSKTNENQEIIGVAYYSRW